jgi:uncharacterized membrane protein/3-hydroxymyristoyl/3-hydroxydecanoyl-(acyl carrier protein) dehydratase
MRWTRICTALSWVLAAASPFVLYAGIKSGRIAQTALVLVAFAALRLVPTLLTARREHLLAALRLPLVALVSALAGVVFREPRVMLALPSLSMAAFGAVFFSSLRGVPLVEHFARLKAARLSPAQVRYCRSVTVVWGVALVTAAMAGLALAAFASLEVWTVFTGVGSYVLVAAIFSVEYIVRKFRFREFGDGPIDMVLARIIGRGPASVRELDLAGADVAIPAEYVFFRGHFEAAPILPAVVQLTEIVLPVVQKRHPEIGRLRQLRRVRFRRPVLPGETVRVQVSDVPGEAARFHFELRVDRALVANGDLMFDPRPRDEARA